LRIGPRLAKEQLLKQKREEDMKQQPEAQEGRPGKEGAKEKLRLIGYCASGCLNKEGEKGR